MTVEPDRVGVELAVPEREALAELLLSVADDEFVIGFWDSEWTGIAPMLEEDVATSSIAQDEIGHARALYELLSQVVGDDPDRIAYGRAPDDYRHAALLNHGRGDWAFSAARRYLYETGDAVRMAALAESGHAPLAAIAGKIRREEVYHLLHAEAWLTRLSYGPAEVRDRLADSLRRLWPDAQELFAPLAGEGVLLASKLLPRSMADLHATWTGRVRSALGALVPDLPALEPSPDGRHRRTDEFRWLHGELTSVARLEEGATW